MKSTHFDLDWKAFTSDFGSFFDSVVDVAIIDEVNVLAFFVLAQTVDFSLWDADLCVADFALNVIFFDLRDYDVDDVILLSWVMRKSTFESDRRIGNDDFAASLFDWGDANIVVLPSGEQEGDNVAMFRMASALDFVLEPFENLVVGFEFIHVVGRKEEFRLEVLYDVEHI